MSSNAPGVSTTASAGGGQLTPSSFATGAFLQGPAGPVPWGTETAWSSTVASYSSGPPASLVSRGGSTYVATAASIPAGTDPATDSGGHWQLVVQAGAPGSGGVSITSPDSSIVVGGTTSAPTLSAAAAIAAETTRAKAAEGTNASSVAAETTRAEAAEGSLQPTSTLAAAVTGIGAPHLAKSPLTGMWHLSAAVTDFTGTVDQSANIQALVNAVAAASVGGRSDAGCGTTSASTTVTDPSAAPGDLYKGITGPGIPARTVITAVTANTGYTISQAANATATGLTFVVGAETGGTILWDKEGVVLTTSSIAWASGVSLKGVHPRLCRWVTSTQTAPLLNLVGSALAPITDINIDGIQFDGSANAATTYTVTAKAIQLLYGKRVHVTNCWVHDFGATGIATDTSYEDVIVSDNYVVNCGRLAYLNTGISGGSGIGIGTVSAGTLVSPDTECQIVANNTVVNCGNYGIFHESQQQATFGLGILVANNICYGNGQGGIGLCGTEYENVVGNICFNNTTWGIQVGVSVFTASTPSRDFLITANQCWNNNTANICIDMSSSDNPHGYGAVRGNYLTGGNGPGILFVNPTSGTGASHSIEITDNTIHSAGQHGISLTGTVVATNLVVKDNTIYDCSQATAATYSGINVGVPLTNPHITGNTVYNDASGATQAYGLNLTTAIIGGEIRDNDFRNNKTSGFHNSGSVDATCWFARNAGVTNHPAGVTVTTGTSPWTYTAPLFPTVLSITGGTVTAVTIAGATAPTTGQLLVEAGDAVVITYSAAPTVTVRPR